MDKERFDQLDDLYITREDDCKEDNLEDLDFDQVFEKATGETYSGKAFLEWCIEEFGEDDLADMIYDKYDTTINERIYQQARE